MKDLEVAVKGLPTTGKSNGTREIEVTHYENGWDVRVAIRRNGGRTRRDVAAMKLSPDEVRRLRRELKKAEILAIRSRRLRGQRGTG